MESNGVVSNLEVSRKQAKAGIGYPAAALPGVSSPQFKSSVYDGFANTESIP